MKTYKNLYPQICSFENLFLAFRAAAKGKRGRADVAAFERDLEPNLFELQKTLAAQTYRAGAYFHFSIADGDGARARAEQAKDGRSGPRPGAYGYW